MSALIDWLTGISPLQKLAMSLAALSAAFSSGYGYCWYQNQIDKAEQHGKQTIVAEVAAPVITLSDESAAARLNTALLAANLRAAGFEQRLKEAADVHPADPDCRLPDSLRNDLNERLAVSPR